MPHSADAPLSQEAQDLIAKLFPCEKPCDSYGICEGCYEKIIFQAGYNLGYRAAPTVDLVALDKELFPNSRVFTADDIKFIQECQDLPRVTPPHQCNCEGKLDHQYGCIYFIDRS